MAYFQPFKTSTGAKTPGFVAAEIGQTEAEMLEKQRIAEMRSQMMLGAGSVYKGVTGKMEKDPIAEGLRKGWDKLSATSQPPSPMGSAQPSLAGETNATMVDPATGNPVGTSTGDTWMSRPLSTPEGPTQLEQMLTPAELTEAATIPEGGIPGVSSAGSSGAVTETAALTPEIAGGLAPEAGAALSSEIAGGTAAEIAASEALAANLGVTGTAGAAGAGGAGAGAGALMGPVGWAAMAAILASQLV